MPASAASFRHAGQFKLITVIIPEYPVLWLRTDVKKGYMNVIRIIYYSYLFIRKELTFFSLLRVGQRWRATRAQQ